MIRGGRSDRIAHACTGPAVNQGRRPCTAAGVDVWAKRGARLVIGWWYKRMTINHDKGEGRDYYKVGPARGCGGLGAWTKPAKKLFVRIMYLVARARRPHHPVRMGS